MEERRVMAKTGCPCDSQLQDHFGPGTWAEWGVGGQGG